MASLDVRISLGMQMISNKEEENTQLSFEKPERVYSKSSLPQ